MKRSRLQRLFAVSFIGSLRMIVWCLMRCRIFRLKTEGSQCLPGEGGFAIIANHRSDFIDAGILGWLVLVNCGQLPCFLAKKEVWKNPVVAWVMDALGQVPVDRCGDPAKSAEAFGGAVTALREGRIVVFFGPGGSEQPGAEPKAWKTGAARAARDAGVSLVPATMIGTDEVRKPGAPWLKTNFLRQTAVIIKEPVSVPKGADPDKIRSITAELQVWSDKQVAQASSC